MVMSLASVGFSLLEEATLQRAHSTMELQNDVKHRDEGSLIE
jgi:hypothetical protein